MLGTTFQTAQYKATCTAKASCLRIAFFVGLAALLLLPLHAGALEPAPEAASAETELASLNGLRVLFLTKSSGFEHSVVKRKDGEAAHAERVFAELAKEHGFEVEATKDASRINAQQLSQIDVVVFYTTGDLTQSGSGEGLFGGDAAKPMAANGVEELSRWLEDGGAFLGFHCATDTFHGKDDTISPYIRMIGAEFKSHGAQFTGTVISKSPGHPILESFPAELAIKDEWYLFKNQFADTSGGEFEVLAVLEPGEAREKQAKLYDIDPYPIVWARDFGQGRMVYNAMGHREDVWTNTDFQTLLLNSLRWAATD